jgi:5-methylcytosine-specific restriction endonuclease McrA
MSYDGLRLPRLRNGRLVIGPDALAHNSGGVRLFRQDRLMAVRPCLTRGCREYTTASRCPQHQREFEAQRAATPGITGRGARSRVPKALRDQVWVRARYSCEECGRHRIPLSNMGLALHVHHVNGDAEDNRLENLRLLCSPGCHEEAHR